MGNLTPTEGEVLPLEQRIRDLMQLELALDSIYESKDALLQELVDRGAIGQTVNISGQEWSLIDKLGPEWQNKMRAEGKTTVKQFHATAFTRYELRNVTPKAPKKSKGNGKEHASPVVGQAVAFPVTE